MRCALLLAAVALAGCGVREEGPPADGGEDYEEYVAKLRKGTPIRVEQFKKKGLKAESYEVSTEYPMYFSEVVVKVPRVYLTNQVTGKGGWYTRARLVLNDPSPGDYEVFGWEKVEMLR